MDRPRTVPVQRVVRNSSRHVTLFFRDPALAGYEPGQFAMVWAPGVDEVPMAIWGGHDGLFRILVEAKGDCTRALAAKGPGDLIGVRGPYGRPFRPAEGRLLVVVGGTGTSPLVPLCERAPPGTDIDVVVGARSREFLLLVDEFEAAGARVHPATDDGSHGFHGRAPDLARRLLQQGAYDQVLTCGPELMMKVVVDAAREGGVPVQASVERDPKFGTDSYASVKADFGAFELSFYVSTQMAARQIMVFHGDRGFIEVASPFNAGLYDHHRIELHDQSRGETNTFRFPGASQYRLQVEAFARAAQGEFSPVFALEESVKNQKAIDAIFRAGEAEGWTGV